jgi:hypothetical protein
MKYIQYRQLEQATSKELQRIVRQFQQTPSPGLEQQFMSTLKDAQKKALLLGKGTNRLTPADIAVLQMRWIHQRKFAKKFFDDMRNGRGVMDYGRRANLYAQQLWALMNRGRIGNVTASKDTRFEWVLDPFAEHCSDCLARAKQSKDQGGFTLDELTVMGYPGETTLCGVNCRCRVIKVKAPPTVQDPRINWGGVILESMLPAAGLPFVLLTREALEESQARFPGQGEAFNQSLERLPMLMAYPTKIDQNLDLDRFTYIGPAGTAVVDRNENGVWQLMAFMPNQEEENKQDVTERELLVI